MRLSYGQLDMIKQKFDVSEIWSYSKYSTYKSCLQLFKLKYIDKIRVKSDNAYTVFGTISHSLIQGLYDGKHRYDEMVEKLNDKVTEWQITNDPKLKFTSDDEAEHYVANLRHYFTHTGTIPADYKVTNEKAVISLFEGKKKYVFQGYIDSIYKDDEGFTNLIDYKTSSIQGFSGAQLMEKSEQLMIYAMGLSQFQKVPINKIRLVFDMMKYVMISYPMKNGNIKETKAERRLWVAKLATQIRKDFAEIPKEITGLSKDIEKLEKKIARKKTTKEEKVEFQKQINDIQERQRELEDDLYDEPEIDAMVSAAIETNSLNAMPNFVKYKYKVNNCYIKVALKPDIIQKFKDHLIGILDEITERKELEDRDLAFDREPVTDSNSFYCATLCDMKDFCPMYKEYKETKQMMSVDRKTTSDAELLAMLGL